MSSDLFVVRGSEDGWLPNLVAGRRIVPELIQSECRPEAIARALLGILDDPAESQRFRKALGEVRQRLGGPGVFERAADAVLAELDGTGRFLVRAASGR